jgi:hypothetical protein
MMHSDFDSEALRLVVRLKISSLVELPDTTLLCE